MSETFGRLETRDRLAVVAIPANNEAGQIEACLAALALQRDRSGAPLALGSFEVLVFANNCIDGTVACVDAMARVSPHPIRVIAEDLVIDKSNAGWARKRAMDLAAHQLVDAGWHNGVILTTDADSIVAPTWIDATMREIADGADAVAGYIDAHPTEMMRLGRAFVERGRLEDDYLRLMAELYSLCDPRPHDPWPTHRVSSGASLAVTLPAYLAIGGLPPKPLGEDAALTSALDTAGFKVRHSMEVCVSTSCRFDGRAKGGAADTMRHRHTVLEAPCDDDIEPALPLVRRALLKGLLRRVHDTGTLNEGRWPQRFGIARSVADALIAERRHAGFEHVWSGVVEASPLLQCRQRLRPSDLPNQIRRAALCLRMMRRTRFKTATGDRAGTPDPAGSHESVAA